MTVTAQLDRDAFRATLDRFCGYGLLTPGERDEVLALFDPDFPFAEAVGPPSRSTSTSRSLMSMPFHKMKSVRSASPPRAAPTDTSSTRSRAEST